MDHIKLAKTFLHIALTVFTLFAVYVLQFALRGSLHLLSLPYEQSNILPQPADTVFSLFLFLSAVFVALYAGKSIFNGYKNISKMNKEAPALALILFILSLFLLPS